MHLYDTAMFLLPYIITALASFAGAWIAAHLALNTFYHQKIWERRADAYSAIFEALFDMTLWYDTNLTAEMRRHDIPEDEQKRMLEEHKLAERTLMRRLARETWLISDENRSVLDELNKIMKRSDFDTYVDYLENGSYGIDQAIIKLRQLVRKEIGPRPSLFSLGIVRVKQP
jgi:hypothetical protein